MLGIGLSITLYMWLEKNELQFTNEKFSHLITQYANAIEYALGEETHSLNALLAYHYGSERISRDEFKRFTSTILGYHTNVHILEWVPKVLYDEKREYEKSVTFTQKNEDGKIIPVKKRSVYYPIYFLEPYKSNEKALGFDIASEKNRLTALNLASKTGEVTATSPITLLQDKEQKIGIILFQAIYKNENDKSSLEGFYLNTIWTSELIEHMLSKISQRCQGVNLNIYDITSKDNKKEVYSKESTCNTDEIALVKSSNIINFAGRKWKLEARATKAFLDQYMTIYPSLVLFVSIMLTILIATVFYLMKKSYKIMSTSNNHLRRFQKLAITREQRIVDLKLENKKLKNIQENSCEK